MGAYAGPDIVESGLVLALDAGNTKSYPGTGTAWTDLSGNGRNGTLFGTVGYSGLNGGSLVFGGQPENTDYFNMTSIFSNAGVTNYSASLWIKLDPSSSGIDSRFFWHGVYGVLISKTNSDQIFFYIRRSAGDDTSVAVSVSPLLGVWVNIVGSYDGSTMRLYVNGDLQGSTSFTGGIINNQSSTLWLGALPLATPPFWTGCNMSQVSIHNRALTAGEVAQNYNATRARFSL